MAKIKIIKKILKYPCYCCKKSIRGKTLKQTSCPACHGTGIYLDEMYYFVVNGVAIDGDTLK